MVVWLGLIVLVSCLVVLVVSCGALPCLFCYLISNRSDPGSYDGSHVHQQRNADGTYTTNLTNERIGLALSVTGEQGLSEDLRAYPDYNDYFSNYSARETQVFGFSTDTPFDSAWASISYDPAEITDPERLAIFYFNETYGLYLPLDTTVDTVHHTASATLPEACTFAGFNASGMADHYRKIAEFNAPIAQYMQPTVVVTVDGDIEVTVVKTGPYWSTVTETKSYHVL